MISLRCDYGRQQPVKTILKHTQPISDLVRRVLDRTPDPPVDVASQNRLDAHWNQTMGTIAQYTTPLLFRSGRLVIYCESGAWSSQIRNRLPSLKAQFRQAGFPVSDLSVSILPAESRSNRRTDPDKPGAQER